MSGGMPGTEPPISVSLRSVSSAAVRGHPAGGPEEAQRTGDSGLGAQHPPWRRVPVARYVRPESGYVAVDLMLPSSHSAPIVLTTHAAIDLSLRLVACAAEPRRFGAQP